MKERKKKTGEKITGGGAWDKVWEDVLYWFFLQINQVKTCHIKCGLWTLMQLIIYDLSTTFLWRGQQTNDNTQIKRRPGGCLAPHSGTWKK